MTIYTKIRNMKTLLIDDDKWIRNSMSIVFENEDCYLKAVETAEEALKELKVEKYNIIICDYKLPGIDGIEFFEKIKDIYMDTIKILITAYGNKSITEDAICLGVNDVIEKPFTTKTIENSLKLTLLHNKL
ncbi:response regulator [bacterium]|nr:response regulator [bacterium]